MTNTNIIEKDLQEKKAEISIKKLPPDLKKQIKEQHGAEWDCITRKWAIPDSELENVTSLLKENQVFHDVDQSNEPEKAANENNVRLHYLLQVDGDPEFRLKKKSACKDGAIAEFLPEGWVYKHKHEAEATAKRWTVGKRIINVALLYEPVLDQLWYGSKEEVKLAKKKIRNELNRFQNNKAIEQIELECHLSPLHSSWLHADADKLPDDMSEEERKAHAYFKPLWDKTFEEQELVDLRETDIIRESEDVEAVNGQVGQEVIINGVPKKVTDMQSLDKRFAQLEAPGQPCVLINRLDSQPISPSDFNRRLNGEVVLVGIDNNEQPKYMPASVFWTGNARKCIYKRIVFTNSQVDNSTYNLFPGFGVTPKQGECKKILNHIKEVICAGDAINNDAMIKLLAWQIQNIGKPSRVITALKSTVQQVGKGCLLADILAPIYDNAGFVTSEINQIITRFNDTIRGKSFLFLDEALFVGDRKSADAIKSLATCTRLGVESKGIPTVQFPIAVNLFLATNHDDAAHIEEDDARYWILEVSSHRAGDSKYFNALYGEINSGGREAFMQYLLNIDISDFIPARDVPKDNSAKEVMIRNSINPFDARNWLDECCESGMIIGHKRAGNTLPYEASGLPWEAWETGKEYDNGIFFSAYREWQKSIRSPIAARETKINKFGELLNKVGFEQRNQGGRIRKLPDPKICKELLEKLFKKSGK